MSTPEPEPGRPTLSTGEAARLLRCSIDTIKNKIRRGEFADGAGQHSNGRWWIYRDHLISDDRDALQQENAALRRRIEELTAASVNDKTASDARHREDRNKLATTMALVGATRAAAERYKRASEQALTLIQHSVDTMGEFKAAADEWMNVANIHLDVLMQDNMPNHPGELDDLGR